ncbi:MAG TPA: iron-sulfur cluster assembly protein [Actinocrinis sp.]|uniref:iron-sulfur cluster assembly protein n=1 Tax=Actinocrinis sp. TaxID=1920516 RepID=UPI002DDCF2AE|nr:iron-sulfur cluster assembly protein [Actinocrinis sp.]HEV2346177.1 iron-sulfur cluster assembly protein [Actinocrinis sp.]
MSAPTIAVPLSTETEIIGSATELIGIGEQRLGEVAAALAGVLDPELDRPITELGFVRGITVSDADVKVRLRLPTYFCAPNFAWLMVDDCQRTLAALPWSRQVTVVLEDHFAAAEINRGVAAGERFADAFPLLADADGLQELRAKFLRKGLLAAQACAVTRLQESGWTDIRIAGATLGELPRAQAAKLIRRRTTLGLTAEAGDPAFTDEHGAPVPAEAMRDHLRRCRTTAVGVSANNQICQGLLAARYGDGDSGSDGEVRFVDRPEGGIR